MSESLRKLQSIQEAKITNRLRDVARRMARAGSCADDISARLHIPLDAAEEIVDQTNQARQVDPEAVWANDRERMELSAPTKELFVELFARRERQRIVQHATNLVRTIAAAHVKRTGQSWAFSDLESVGTVAAIEAIDALLQKPDAGQNPGSYIWDAIHGAVVEPNRDFLSRPYIIVRPRGQKAKHRRVESQWPKGARTRGADKMFDGGREEFDPSGQKVGQRRNRQPLYAGRSIDQTADDWEFLAEVCDDDELTLLEMLASGLTQDHVARELSINVSTLRVRLNKIRAKVQSQLHQCDGGM
jgi:hypothetical protein